MKLNCYCGRGVEISPKNFKYLLYGFELFCGPECFLEYIQDFTPKPTTLKARNPFVSSPFDCWDHETNQFYRSFFEIYIARFFKRNSIRFYYEPYSFFLTSKYYTPDFYLLEKDLYIEVKGLWNSGAKDKIREAEKGINISVLPAYLQKEFEKQYKTKDDIIGG